MSHTSETPIAAAPPKSESEDMTTHVNHEVTTPPAPAPAQQHPERTPTLETTTPSSPTHIPAAPPPQTREDEVDPAIASLVAIFPTFDHDLLREILRECGGNEEQAVDILLGMSDPSHVPTINATTVSSLVSFVPLV